MVFAKNKLLSLLLCWLWATTGPEKYDRWREEGGSPIERPTYAFGQTIRSNASAPEKRHKKSDLKYQGIPETRQSGTSQWNPKKARDTLSKQVLERPAKTEQAPNNNTPRQRKPAEWRTGNTKNAPIELAWNPQGIQGATDAPAPKQSIWDNGWEDKESKNRRCWTMHLLINKKTTNRCSRNWVTEHTPIKKSMQSGECHHQAMSYQ